MTYNNILHIITLLRQRNFEGHSSRVSAIPESPPFPSLHSSPPQFLPSPVSALPVSAPPQSPQLTSLRPSSVSTPPESPPFPSLHSSPPQSLPSPFSEPPSLRPSSVSAPPQSPPLPSLRPFPVSTSPHSPVSALLQSPPLPSPHPHNIPSDALHGFTSKFIDTLCR